jgi:hypothetical protein
VVELVVGRLYKVELAPNRWFFGRLEAEDEFERSFFDVKLNTQIAVSKGNPQVVITEVTGVY